METRIGTLNIRPSSAIMLAIACLILLPSSASAQSASGSKVQMQEMDKRQLQLSDLGKGNRKETDPKRAQAIKNQLNEDFSRILKLHNDMVHIIAGKSPMDFQFIAEATGEINKRALRLQSTLALHKVEGSEQDAQERADVQTKGELIKLCRKIELFVKNPVIDTPGTVDAEQLEKARRDLESVVELSGAIKKDAERQKKVH